ncbi:MAG: hypothetical protein J1E06_05735 [Acutalibacter sp.]|nr:hypothetical protein [Acutalibacter sp.]
MAEKYFPFDSVDGDREYHAGDFASYFAEIISSGVSSVGSNLQVANEVNGSDPKDQDVHYALQVRPGSAWIKGHFYQNTETLRFNLSSSIDMERSTSQMYDRVDRIVTRLYVAERKIETTVIQGVPAEKPSPPDLVRNDDYWDICLAEVTVKRHGTIGESFLDIKDTRTNEGICGVVKCLIEGTSLKDFVQDLQMEYDAMLQESKEAFTEWFNAAKEVFASAERKADDAAEKANRATTNAKTAKEEVEKAAEDAMEQAEIAEGLIEKAKEIFGAVDGDDLFGLINDESRHVTPGEKAFLRRPFWIETYIGTSESGTPKTVKVSQPPKFVIVMCADNPPVVPRADGKYDVFWGYFYAADDTYKTTYALGNGISYDSSKKQISFYSGNRYDGAETSSRDLIMALNKKGANYVVLYLPFLS